jgi:hypothetical protein
MEHESNNEPHTGAGRGIGQAIADLLTHNHVDVDFETVKISTTRSQFGHSPRHGREQRGAGVRVAEVLERAGSWDGWRQLFCRH